MILATKTGEDKYWNEMDIPADVLVAIATIIYSPIMFATGVGIRTFVLT